MVRFLRAFTLVEMLVVMGIIALLAGLLLPALATARERGRKAACSSNLGQTGKSVMIYLNDNSEYYPSYPNYGADSPAIEPWLPTVPRRIQEYQNKPDYDRLSSRNMVIAYVSGRDPSDLTLNRANPRPNFIASGLGLMLKKHQLKDGDVLLCPSLSGTVSTYYGHGAVISAYKHHLDLWKRLNASTHMQAIEQGNGTWLDSHGASEKAIATLSSYAYRLQPFYWAAGTQGAVKTVEHTRPVQAAGFMCPPFKSRKQLGLRALLSDSFDYGKTSWTRSMAYYHHNSGFNVLFADGHAEWYYDGKRTITDWKWTDWPSADLTNDLTISSPLAQEVWHVFDTTNEVDVGL
jgi:prepilin-type processing-associated H-X9-DG protein/prepilin-type N-terminal cleavage/methylation domain-containing protein